MFTLYAQSCRTQEDCILIMLILCNTFKLDWKDLKCQTPTEQCTIVLVQKVFGFTEHTEEI